MGGWVERRFGGSGRGGLGTPKSNKGKGQGGGSSGKGGSGRRGRGPGGGGGGGPSLVSLESYDFSVSTPIEVCYDINGADIVRITGWDFTANAAVWLRMTIGGVKVEGASSYAGGVVAGNAGASGIIQSYVRVLGSATTTGASYGMFEITISGHNKTDRPTVIEYHHKVSSSISQKGLFVCDDNLAHDGFCIEHSTGGTITNGMMVVERLNVNLIDTVVNTYDLTTTPASSFIDDTIGSYDKFLAITQEVDTPGAVDFHYRNSGVDETGSIYKRMQLSDSDSSVVNTNGYVINTTTGTGYGSGQTIFEDYELSTVPTSGMNQHGVSAAVAFSELAMSLNSDSHDGISMTSLSGNITGGKLYTIGQTFTGRTKTLLQNIDFSVTSTTSTIQDDFNLYDEIVITCTNYAGPILNYRLRNPTDISTAAYYKRIFSSSTDGYATYALGYMITTSTSIGFSTTNISGHNLASRPTSVHNSMSNSGTTVSFDTVHSAVLEAHTGINVYTTSAPTAGKLTIVGIKYAA